MLDFPNSPTVGQQFSSATGTFSWDGTKWKPLGPIASISDAPSDGNIYARQNALWVPVPSSISGITGGLQVNGAFFVQQLGSGNHLVGPNTTGYVCDGWQIQTAGVQIVAGNQAGAGNVGDNSSSSGISANLGSLTMSCPSTAAPSPAPGDYVVLAQIIEGYRFQRLGWGYGNAAPLTIGFWIWADVPGTYSVSIRNAALNLSYVVPFTINTADVWQYIKVTIPPPTWGGATWVGSNLASAVFGICLTCGANNITSQPNTWLAANFVAATGQGNALNSTSVSVIVSGVTMFPGSSGPTAANSGQAARPLGDELVICQRYYEKSYDLASAPGKPSTTNGAFAYYGVSVPNGNNIGFNFVFKERKRTATPSVVTYSTNTGAANMAYDLSNSVDLSTTVSTQSESSSAGWAAVGATATRGMMVQWTADSRL